MVVWCAFLRVGLVVWLAFGCVDVVMVAIV